MRIAVIARSANREGGVETYLERLLPLLRDAGHELGLFVERAQDPTRGLTLPGLAATLLEPASAGVRQVLAWAPQVAFTHGLIEVEREGALVRAVPTVSFAHDYQATCLSGAKSFRRPSRAPCARRCGAACLVLYFPRGCGGRDPRTLARAWWGQRRRIANLAASTAVVTFSHHMRDEVVRHGVAEARASVLPVLPPWPPPSSIPPASQSEVVRVASLGRLEPEKGGLVLLAALGQVAARLRRGIELTFAGEGTARAALEREAARLTRRHPGVRVRFPGWLSPAEVAGLLARSELLALPSTWPEPYGLVGVEAGQWGVPAVAFGLGGIPEWLAEGRSGALAPADPPSAAGLADAILRCLQDPARFEELRTGARQLALLNTPARHVEALSAVLAGAARG